MDKGGRGVPRPHTGPYLPIQTQRLVSVNISLSISIYIANSYLPITIHTNLPHNKAATNTTINTVKFTEVTALYVYQC